MSLPAHLDPERRHDFVYLFDVKDGNPNGDPDAGNLPRVDPETMHGLVTDVALKRKIRNYVDMTRQGCKGYRIFVQSRTALNTIIAQAFAESGAEVVRVRLPDDEARILAEHASLLPAGLSLLEQDGHLDLAYDGSLGRSEREVQEAVREAAGGSEEVAAALRPHLHALLAGARAKKARGETDGPRRWLTEHFFDIRLFGAVLSTGLNAGQVRGPVQITFGRSLDPVTPLDLLITRAAVTREQEARAKHTEMGRKAVVPYALYRVHGFYSPFLGRQTGASAEDLAVLWEALLGMFELDRAAARGEMNCRGLYVFSHDDPKGSASSALLFDLVRSEGGVTAARSFRDYQGRVGLALPEGVELRSSPPPARARLPWGVTLTVLWPA